MNTMTIVYIVLIIGVILFVFGMFELMSENFIERGTAIALILVGIILLAIAGVSYAVVNSDREDTAYELISEDLGIKQEELIIEPVNGMDNYKVKDNNALVIKVHAKDETYLFVIKEDEVLSKTIIKGD